LLLTKNSFTFYICKFKEYSKCRDKTSPDVINIGPDVRYKNEDIPLAIQQVKDDVQFKVDLGTDKNIVLDQKTIPLLNFIGDPNTPRTLFIEGRFDLGIKTTQGWTYAEAIRIEWQFCPDLQGALPIHTCP
jgi:hypothetical protein